MGSFEDLLSNMSKPEVSDLKHAGLLAKAITNAKDKTVVSFWWLLIPLYVLAALVMKSIYMPHNSFRDNLHELASKDSYTSLLLFLVLPILLIIINTLSIRKIYFLSGKPELSGFVKHNYTYILFIIVSLLLLIIYFI